jgi:hypothetical protein
MSTSYYIEQIEKNLKKFKVNPNDCWEYNAIFDAESDKEYRRRLMFFNEKLNKLSEEWSNLEALQKHNAIRNLSGKLIGE